MSLSVLLCSDSKVVGIFSWIPKRRQLVSGLITINWPRGCGKYVWSITLFSGNFFSPLEILQNVSEEP